MNEKEFDIQVRNLLLDAQEPVSPKVWDGVEAALDKPRRVVPFRYWGYAGLVAAAAAVALFVLLKPAAPVVDPVHSNPSIFMSEASGETEPALEEAAPVLEEAPVQLVQLPRSKPQVLAQASGPVITETETPQAPEQEVPAREETDNNTPSAKPAPQKPRENTSVSQDNTLLNSLAFEEKNDTRKKEGSVSLLTFGNLQGTQRSGIHGDYRRYSAPALNAEVGVYNESPEVRFSLPFSVGVGVQFNLNQRWSLGTGLRYTNLQRTFVGDFKGDGFYLSQTDIDNTQHWLGVPVNVYYNFLNTNRWRIHAFAGGSAEWLLDNHFLVHSSPNDIHHHQKGQYIQWSGALGVGIEYKITPWLGLYLDPSFRYFFNTERQPRSLRTIQPLRFDVEAGLRFSIGK